MGTSFDRTYASSLGASTYAASRKTSVSLELAIFTVSTFVLGLLWVLPPLLPLSPKSSQHLAFFVQFACFGRFLLSTFSEFMGRFLRLFVLLNFPVGFANKAPIIVRSPPVFVGSAILSDAAETVSDALFSSTDLNAGGHSNFESLWLLARDALLPFGLLTRSLLAAGRDGRCPLPSLTCYLCRYCNAEPPLYRAHSHRTLLWKARFSLLLNSRCCDISPQRTNRSLCQPSRPTASFHCSEWLPLVLCSPLLMCTFDSLKFESWKAFGATLIKFSTQMYHLLLTREVRAACFLGVSALSLLFAVSVL